MAHRGGASRASEIGQCQAARHWSGVSLMGFFKMQEERVQHRHEHPQNKAGTGSNNNSLESTELKAFPFFSVSCTKGGGERMKRACTKLGAHIMQRSLACSRKKSAFDFRSRRLACASAG